MPSNRYVTIEKETLEQMKENIAVLEKLLENRMAVMLAIPECPLHGNQCIPHAIEWIEKQKANPTPTALPSNDTPGHHHKADGRHEK